MADVKNILSTSLTRTDNSLFFNLFSNAVKNKIDFSVNSIFGMIFLTNCPAYQGF